MTKFKFGDKVRVLKDDDSDGFFIGATGTLVDYRKSDEMPYYILLDVPCNKGYLFCKENDIELWKN